MLLHVQIRSEDYIINNKRSYLNPYQAVITTHVIIIMCIARF